MRRQSILRAMLTASTLCGILLATPSQAQDADDDKSEIVVSGERQNVLDSSTETGSRLGLSVRETPATLDVLTRERFLERGLRTSNEALNSAPGVTAIDTSGTPATVAMRGFYGNAVSINYDGIQQQATMTSRNMDSFAFERIEVLKGPSSVLFGTGALGGSVNFVPKKPELTRNAFQGLAQYGSRDTFRTAADANIVLDDETALRGILSYAGGDGYIDRARTRTLTANLGLTYKPADNLSVFVSAEHFWNNNGSNYSGTPLVASTVARDGDADVARNEATGFLLDRTLRKANFAYEDGVVRSDQTWLRSVVEWQINSTWRFRNDLNYYNSDRLWFGGGSLSYNATNGLYNRNPSYLRNKLDFWNERATLAADSTLFGHRNRFLVGYEHSYNDGARVTHRGPTIAIDPYTFVPGPSPARDLPAAGSHERTVAKITTDAFFFEEAFNINSKWLLVGGARYEEIKVDRTLHDYFVNSDIEYDKKYVPFSYRIGTVYDIAPRTQIYAQFTEASAPIATLLLISRSNTQFTLSRGQSAEVGVKSSFLNNTVDATLAAYWIRQSDIITRDPIDFNLSVQGGTQSSRGIELSAAAKVTEQLRVDVNYAFVDAQFDELIESSGADRSGNTPPNTPTHIFNAFASYRFDQLPVKVTVGARHSSRVFGDNANAVVLSGRTVFDASIGYNFPFGELTLRGRNLTDELYAEWGGSNAVYLAAPRSVDLTLLTKF